MIFYTWAPSSEFVSSSIPSWQTLTAHAQTFRGARDLAFCLKVPLDSLLVWASSEGSGETARMRRLTWTFAARIGYKYQIRLTRSTLTFAGPRARCWKPEPERRGFNSSWGAMQMLVHKKIKFNNNNNDFIQRESSVGQVQSSLRSSCLIGIIAQKHSVMHDNSKPFKTKGSLVLYHSPECLGYAELEQTWKYISTQCCMSLHACRSIRKQIWPRHKNGQGQPRVIIWKHW